MEYLASLPWYLNKVVTDTIFTDVTEEKVNFHWGDEYELNKYLSVDQDDNFGKLLMSGTVESSYPLIWLVKGYSFSPTDYSEETYLFENIKIFFFKRTDMDWLNKERWKDNIHSLYGLGHLFKDTLKKDQFSDVYVDKMTWYEDDRVSIKTTSGEGSKSVDNCDSIVLKIKELKINTECFKYMEHVC